MENQLKVALNVCEYWCSHISGRSKKICKICPYLKKKFFLRPSTKNFRFADAVYQSLGTIDFPLSTPRGIPIIFVKMEVVSADIPALFGLEVLDDHSLTADTVKNFLVRKSAHTLATGKYIMVEEWSVPLVRADGHVFAEIARDYCIFFTTAQLRKLHRRFVDPSADKLYNLLKRARPEETSKATLGTFKNLTQ